MSDYTLIFWSFVSLCHSVWVIIHLYFSLLSACAISVWMIIHWLKNVRKGKQNTGLRLGAQLACRNVMGTASEDGIWPRNVENVQVFSFDWLCKMLVIYINDSTTAFATDIFVLFFALNLSSTVSSVLACSL